VKEIKRYSGRGLAEIFGLDRNSGSFICKSADLVAVRSSEPHRKEMFTLGIITSGAAELKVGLNNYRVKAPGLVAIGPDDVRQLIISCPDTKITGLFFTEDFVVSGLTEPLFLRCLPLYQKAGRHFISLNADELGILKLLFGQIENKYLSADRNKMEIIQAMLRLLLLEVKNLEEITIEHGLPKASRAHYLTSKFKELLLERFAMHRTVSYYADQLFVSPKHLSQTVKAQMGKTACELIDEVVCLEAKVLLQIEELIISQVSQQLNFADPSTFGKFFKRSIGMSPKNYRNKLAQS
jgi:AraC family transcriptional activator of pobA